MPIRANLILALALIIANAACAKKKSEDSSTDEGGTTDSTQTGDHSGASADNLSLLSQTLITDLIRNVSPSGPNSGSTPLTESQANAIGASARAAIAAAGLATSTDATKLTGVIMQGALSSLSSQSVGLSDSNHLSPITNLMASSLYSSLNAIEPANLPEASAIPGLSPKATAQAAIARGAISAVPNALVGGADFTTSLGSVAQAMVAKINALGSDEETILQVDLPAVGAGLATAAATLPASSGDKGSILKALASGAVKGLASLAPQLTTHGNADRAVSVLVGAITENIDAVTFNSVTARQYATDVRTGGTASVSTVATAFGLANYERDDLINSTAAAASKGLSIVATKLATSASRASTSSVVSGMQTNTISPNVTFGLSAGTYSKFIVDSFGRITGTSSISPSDLPNLPASIIAAGTLPIVYGGTGSSSFTVNGVILGNGSNNLFSTAAGNSYEVLTVSSSGGTPQFGPIHLSQANAITGILPTYAGGTGVASTAIYPASGTIVTASSTATITNKTLTSPIINAGTISGSSLITGSTNIFTSGGALITGNVGIGTTNPTQKLQVGAAADGTLAIANGWNTFSDRRLKRDLVPIDGALDKLMQLRGYYYFWNIEGDQSRQLGVVAQDLEAVFPELVKTDSSGIKTVDYPRLTAVLIEALRQQQAHIAEMSTDSAELKSALCAKFQDLSVCVK